MQRIADVSGHLTPQICATSFPSWTLGPGVIYHIKPRFRDLAEGSFSILVGASSSIRLGVRAP